MAILLKKSAKKNKKTGNPFWAIKGTCEWAKVFKPDTQFNADGVFSIDILLTEKDADTVRKSLLPIAQEEFDKLSAEKPVLKKQGSVVDFVKEVYDEDGETVGYKMTLKQGAKGNNKGEVFDVTIPVVDGKGNTMNGSQLIGNGSTVACMFEPVAYFNAKDKAVGVTLRLKQVKVLELVSYSASRDMLDEFESDFSAENSDVPEATNDKREDDEPFDTDDGDDNNDGEVY
jgi:hypothetical protein